MNRLTDNKIVLVTRPTRLAELVIRFNRARIFRIISGKTRRITAPSKTPNRSWVRSGVCR
jgi:hypothetical protein